MHRRLSALLLLAALVPAQEVVSVREVVLPTKAEQSWQSIAWRPTLWDGVVAAHNAKKPILLWAMNGHPLGLT